MRCWYVPLLSVPAAGIARLPQSWLLALGRTLVWLLWPLLRERRRIVAINIGLCFPELDAMQRRDLVRRSVESAMLGVLESIRAWYAPAWALRGLADISGLEHLEAALRTGKGVILLESHTTPLTLSTRFLNDAVRERVWIMMRPHNNACLEREIDRHRRAYCGMSIHKRDARGLLRALAQGRAVAYAADQDFNFQHAFLPFFGVPAATLLAAPSLARRSGATVLPLWIWREDEGRYSVRIDPPWSQWPSQDDAADMQRYLQALEAQVRRHPEQYLWVHRRFKTRPIGEAPLY